MCAAPGGKTTHIATLAHDRARIFALDKNVSKGTLWPCAA
jgi:16S rRNA C967 or C1407 C5-methylase (RsmB/RsmF family)